MKNITSEEKNKPGVFTNTGYSGFTQIIEPSSTLTHKAWGFFEDEDKPGNPKYVAFVQGVKDAVEAYAEMGIMNYSSTKIFPVAEDPDPAGEELNWDQLSTLLQAALFKVWEDLSDEGNESIRIDYFLRYNQESEQVEVPILIKAISAA